MKQNLLTTRFIFMPWQAGRPVSLALLLSFCGVVSGGDPSLAEPVGAVNSTQSIAATGPWVGPRSFTGPGKLPGYPGKATSPLLERNENRGKVSSLLQEAQRMVRNGRTMHEVANSMPWVRVRGQSIDIEIRFRNLTPAVVDELKALGLQVTKASYTYGRVYGLCKPETLDAIAALPEVRTVHPNYRPVQRVGVVDSQADLSIGAAAARAAFGVDGSGIDVGILSDSFYDVIGGVVTGTGCAAVLAGSGPQFTGDLPAEVIVLDNGPISETGTDEGAALAELVHDLAPGAGIMFHSAYDSMAAMAEGIDQLRACGADVIVDDVLYLDEPMFQDGIIASAAQRAVDAGVVYFAAAGNESRYGVDEFYVDAIPALDNTLIPPNGFDFHDFGGGDRYAAITVPPGCGVGLVLQWNEPFDGMLGPGASSDLDLYFCTTQNPGDCIFGSATVTGCGISPGTQAGDPLEFLAVQNQGTVSATIYAAVEHHCGNEALRFRMATFPIGLGCGLGQNIALESGIFDKAQIYGHAAAAGTIAAGAAFYHEIDTGGDYDAPPGVINVEYFSSLGGELPFYFDGSGNPLPGAPVLRFKPEIVTPDGVNTSFFGTDIPLDPDSYPNIFGTSPASAHAAAVGALVRERNLALSPGQIRTILMDTAIDIESSGIDSLSGAGLVDAFAAVQEVPAGPQVCTEELCDYGGDGKADVLLRNSSGSWYYYPMDGKTYIAGQEGFANLIRNTDWQYQGSGDFNGDGKGDVLLRHTDGRWYYYPMDGKSYLAGQEGFANLIRNTAWQFAGIGDMNGDGKDDVLLRHTDGRWYYYPMDGKSYIAGQEGFANLIRNTDWQFAGMGDMNGDDKDDVLLRHTDGRWYYYPMDGKTYLAGQEGFANLVKNTAWQYQGMGDMNGDDKDDVLLRHTDGRWFYYPMDGKTYISGQEGFANLVRNTAWQFAGMGDMNGDGKDDVLLRHTDGRWYYYPMDGKTYIVGQEGFANLIRNTDWALP